MATSQFISKAASTSSSLTNNQSKNNNSIQEADSTFRTLNHCCFCGILLDPKNLTVNVNTQSITVWCNNCRKTNALGKIRHGKGKEEKRKM
ncbi:hypothetical protein DAPPUDRAFT_302064 [Daphnia pulex]|uniref:Uncharacterized protein n=1 Tax=Daphnia pulex TaxID=6669 RepID=E9GBE0_DAPPU|nr:hypothetical protein DAPPUDRAFT_302064 [Daphnia pulex]|eukprot:EFX82943.1 hypothetical protein DAPPUDRAFT_302064 [Daphnia pulex]